MCLDTSVPLNYYTVFHHIQEIIPKGIFHSKVINSQSYCLIVKLN